MVQEKTGEAEEGMEETTEQAGVSFDPQGLRWCCTRCNESLDEVATTGNYIQFVGVHSKKTPGNEECHVALLNIETGNYVANNVFDARKKGFFPPMPSRGKTRKEGVPGSKQTTEEEGTRVRSTVPKDNVDLIGGYFKTQRFAMPVKLLELYRLFIEEELIERNPATGKYPEMGEFLVDVCEALLDVMGYKLALVKIERE